MVVGGTADSATGFVEASEVFGAIDLDKTATSPGPRRRASRCRRHRVGGLSGHGDVQIAGVAPGYSGRRKLGKACVQG